MAHRYRNLLVRNQILKLQLRALVHNLRAPRIAVFVANLFKLLHDYPAQLGFAGQNRLEFRNLLANLFQLLQDFVDGKLGQPVELQFENGVDLPQRQPALLVRQPLPV